MMERTESRTDTLWVCIDTAPLDIAAIAAFLPDPRVGGIDLFVGTTRQWTGEKETVLLAYECFPAMAIKEMQRIGQAAAARWGLARVALHHRLGPVPAGEASVILGAAAAHRGDAFDACRYLIDTLKKDVPIWKKEHFADGTQEWVQSGG
ncbi:MAG: molybdenum cofactor biosynthesis protein MoaE [Rhodothermales bacterium]